MNLGPWEFLIIGVVVILLFGASKMPKMARSLGQSMRILKAETKGMRGDDEAGEKKDEPAAKPEPRQLPTAQTDNGDEVARLREQLAAAEAKATEPKAEPTQANKNAG